MENDVENSSGPSDRKATIRWEYDCDQHWSYQSDQWLLPAINTIPYALAPLLRLARSSKKLWARETTHRSSTPCTSPFPDTWEGVTRAALPQMVQIRAASRSGEITMTLRFSTVETSSNGSGGRCRWAARPGTCRNLILTLCLCAGKWSHHPILASPAMHWVLTRW